MNNKIAGLVEEFKRISFLNWIPSVNKGTGGVGLTFENELNKKPDSLYFPDFEGVEIKCTTRYSRFPFSLFSISFDGPTYHEINRIINLYGYNDYKFPDKKVLKVDLNVFKVTTCGDYSFKLYIDKNNNKLFLEVYDLNNNLIERKSFVYLDSLLNRLELKLKYLVIIRASKKRCSKNEFFRYYELNSYLLKDKSLFLKLLEEEKIVVTLECRIGKSGSFYGKYKNKNLVFKIKRDFIEELFSKVFYINTDEVNLRPQTINIDHFSKNSQ